MCRAKECVHRLRLLFVVLVGMSSLRSAKTTIARPSHSHDPEEGVLKDVLDELDRERSRRAELEEQVRKLQEESDAVRKSNQQAQYSRAQNNSEAHQVSHRVFVSMETEVKGYQQIVDALTLGKPAIAAAAAAERANESRGKGVVHRSTQAEHHRKTLPLHVVRLLEVLPWDPRAQQYIFAVEEIFEWQVYQNSAWQAHLRFFPTGFKTLPLVKAEASNATRSVDDGAANQSYATNRGSSPTEKKDHRNFLSFLAGADMQSPVASRRRNKHRIFTNERVTALYDLDAGYPLPNRDGCVWEWVGWWRAGTRVSTGSVTDELDNHSKVDSDQSGWSYVVEPRDFYLGLPDMIWDNAAVAIVPNPTVPSQGRDAVTAPTRPYRRRRWTRHRVLVDYLHASEPTRQYLKLLAENARLSVAAGKINDQLVETKLTLTETEEKLVEASDLLQRKVLALPGTRIIAEGVDRMGANVIDDELGIDSLRSIQSTGSRTNDARDFGFKFSQWVHSTQTRKTSDDMNTRKTSDDMTVSLEESVEDASFQEHNSARDGTLPDPVESSMEKFDWKKIGRVSLLDKLKPIVAAHPGRAGPPFIKRSSVGKIPSTIQRSASEVISESSTKNQAI